jgi:hypothetical protein
VVWQVQTNGELRAIHAAGVGLIFNDFTNGPTGATDNVLHTADCIWIERMLLRADPTCPPSVRKFAFDTLAEAQAWLSIQRGPAGSFWKYCTRCQPGLLDGNPVPAAMPAITSVQARPQRAEVFREREVEQLLYAHLRKHGYTVQQQVAAPSGVIDAVATQGKRRVVIEVKGEDAGGYGSTQMNLQMAIGQIASRMTDHQSSYAIAIPLTPSYVRALRTFRRSHAFQQLNLALYLVERSGEIRQLGADEVSAWIEELAP